MRVPCGDITPGTLVVVYKGEVVPCDLLLVTSGAEEGDGRVYVETAALDGESDLKPRSAPAVTACTGVEELSHLSGTVDCPLPNAQLYAFDALLHLDDVAGNVFISPAGASAMPATGTARAAPMTITSPEEVSARQQASSMEVGESTMLTPPRRRDTLGSVGAATPVNGDSLLQGGTVVRDTPWAAGWAVYTGDDTKAAQCSTGVPIKISDIEGRVNSMTWLIFRVQLVIVLVLTGAAIAWNTPKWLGEHWYLGYSKHSSVALDALVLCVRFLLLNSFMIPVSLKVLLDLAKGAYASQVAADSSMAAVDGRHARVANSNCLEDCGVISHVLTDKTGTLTDNVMHFEGSHVVQCEPRGPQGGLLRMPVSGYSLPLSDVALKQSPGQHEHLFWSALVLCSAAHAQHQDVVHPGSQHKPWQWHPAGLAKLLERPTVHNTNPVRATCEEADTLLGEEERGGGHLQHLQTASDVAAHASAAQQLLAAQHTVRRAVSFHSPSPDEEALVHAAACRGYVLSHRSPGPQDSEFVQLAPAKTVADAIHVCACASTYPLASVLAAAGSLSSKTVWYAEGAAEPGHDALGRFHVLHTVPFTSTRKRMAVVVRGAGESARSGAWLLMKGADEVMLPRLRPKESTDTTAGFLEVSAKRGLRTLVVAARFLSCEELAGWESTWHLAQARLHERDAAMAAAADRLEHSLTLLGATAIRDALQPGVPSALQALRSAGVATWMLTGDKMETALQIAQASQLVRPFVSVSHTDTGSWSDDAGLPMLHLIGDTNADISDSVRSFHAFAASTAVSTCGYAITVSGNAASTALNSSSIATQFRELLLNARQVVCCRASPGNKAELVQMCKAHLQHTRVLSIGDGGNDVPMIQAAHVGIGISGREGEAASRTADVAIPRFSALVPLLLYHGRRAHRATSFLAQFALYKSMFMCSQQILFNCFAAGLAGSSMFDSFSLTAFNTLFTTAPLAVLCYGDDLNLESSLANPTLYRQSLANRWMTSSSVLGWAVLAWLHGVAVWAAALSFVVIQDSVVMLSYASFSAVLSTVLLGLWVASPIKSRALLVVNCICQALFAMSIILRSSLQGESAAVASAVIAQLWTHASFLPWIAAILLFNVLSLWLLARSHSPTLNGDRRLQGHNKDVL